MNRFTKKNEGVSFIKNKMKILVVEDEAISALLLNIYLESLGYDIGEAVATGEEAVLKANEVRPDIVLMDIQLAGEMNGIDAAREIILRNKNTVIAFLTAYSDEETIARAKKLAPVAYLIKPFEMVELKNIIDSIQ